MLVALEGTVSLYVPLFLSLINGAGESVITQKHRLLTLAVRKECVTEPRP